MVATGDGKPADEDWFAVALTHPVTARRVVFTGAKPAHDGGWFDTPTGKPRVQVQRMRGGAWETIGELHDYPATTGVNGVNSTGARAARVDGQFTLKLAAPETFTALRVIGVPACGDSAGRSSVSCAELQAFAY